MKYSFFKEIFSAFFLYCKVYFHVGGGVQNICLGHKHNPNHTAIIVYNTKYIYKHTWSRWWDYYSFLHPLVFGGRFRCILFGVDRHNEQCKTKLWQKNKQKINHIKNETARLFTSLINVCYCDDQKNRVMFISRILWILLLLLETIKNHRESAATDSRLNNRIFKVVYQISYTFFYLLTINLEDAIFYEVADDESLMMIECRLVRLQWLDAGKRRVGVSRCDDILLKTNMILIAWTTWT